MLLIYTHKIGVKDLFCFFCDAICHNQKNESAMLLNIKTINQVVNY